jgi:hypothetical protein
MYRIRQSIVSLDTPPAGKSSGSEGARDQEATALVSMIGDGEQGEELAGSVAATSDRI